MNRFVPIAKCIYKYKSKFCNMTGDSVIWIHSKSFDPMCGRVNSLCNALIRGHFFEFGLLINPSVQNLLYPTPLPNPG